MIKGRVFRFGDHIDTDGIIPARHLAKDAPEELSKHCMEDVDPTFASRVKPGDIIVGGRNFGCGSSREHAVIAIKASGVSVVVAKSFARLFFRNAINVGLPVVVCPEAADIAQDGDIMEVDLEKGVIKLKGSDYKFEPFSGFVIDIIKAGGLVQYSKQDSRLQGGA